MTIKLPDPSRSGGSDDTDDIRELVPWYVNGTLPEHEARRVEDRAAADPEIAQDIRQQRSLAQRVATEDPFDVPLKQSWEKLRAEAMADISARSPAVQPWHRRVTERFEGRAAAIFGTVALACAALVLVVQVPGPGSDDFVTLTSPTDGSELAIKFQPSGELDAEALAALGVLSVSGPSESGVYTALVAEDADAMAIARAMMARDDILFAAAEVGQ